MRHRKETRVRECLECHNTYIEDYVKGICPDCIIRMIMKNSLYPELSIFMFNGELFPKRRKDDHWDSIDYEFYK